MTDIFDTTILCRNCKSEMRPAIVNKNGFELRAVECKNCGDKIIHPADLNGMEHFKDIKDKKFNVKLRMVGNSHAISIPKEIIDFMNERHREMKREMDSMVQLCFDDFDTLKVSFLDDEGEDEQNFNGEYDNAGVRRRVRDYGKGNVDIIEEQNINSNGIKGFRIRKVTKRRNL